MAIDTRYQRLPFEEAVTYLAEKITIPTDSWRDIRDDEHDAFFVIAGAKGSMLSELREAVETAIRTGQRLEDFRPTFERIAQGWEYNGTAGWRSRIILQTNLRASYGRGREEMQLDPEVLRLQPYLRYVHGGSTNPRPHHLALNGQVFTADTMPWSLPNGYSCSCRYVSLSSRRLQQLGLQPSTLRRGDTMPDGRPLEPDKGWDRQPGQARGARRDELIQRVIDRSPPEIARQVRADVAAYRPPAQANPTPSPKPPATPGERAKPKVKLPEDVEVYKDKGYRTYTFETSGGDPVEMKYEKTGKYWSVDFTVDDSYSRVGLDSREGTRVALKLSRIQQHEISKAPDGRIYKTEPYSGDGLGEARSSLYQRGGFAPPIGGVMLDNEGNEAALGVQYGVVRRGRLVPSDADGNPL